MQINWNLVGIGNTGWTSWAESIAEEAEKWENGDTDDNWNRGDKK